MRARSWSKAVASRFRSGKRLRVFLIVSDMIATLTGTIAHKGDDHVVIDVNGVGYQAFMNGPSLAALRTGTETRIWTHEHAREDERDLFGFLSQSELRLFKKLLVTE